MKLGQDVTFDIQDVTSDGWITEQGVVLVISGSNLSQVKVVQFSAKLVSSVFDEPLEAFAICESTLMDLPIFLSQKGQKVNIKVYLSSLVQHYPLKQARVKLTFSDFFVPSELGISSDSRKLVLWKPQKKKIFYS